MSTLGKEIRRQEFRLTGWSQSPAPPVGGHTIDPVDLLQHEVRERALEALRPQVIVHCAALANVDRCEREPELAMALNQEVTEHLARFAARTSASLVFISSDAVYDGDAKGRHVEDEELRPSNHYARSKVLAEEAVRRHLPADQHLILRANMFGWNAKRTLGAAEWMLHTLVAGSPLNLFHDVIFSPLLVNDLAVVIAELLTQPSPRRTGGTFNIGACDHMSKYEFGLLLARVFNLPTAHIRAVSVDSHKFEAKRAKNMALNTQRLALALGRPLPSIAEGVAHFHQLLQNGSVAQLKNLKNFRLQEWPL